MGVPTIDTCTPAVGHPGGGGLIEITGTGFKLWTIPAPNGKPATPIRPTVRVRFDGVAGADVMVISATRLFVRVPRTPFPIRQSTNYGEGDVGVEVANLDASGVPIPGESITKPGAYRFQRSQLAVDSDLNRLCRALIQEFRAQVIANTSMSTHTDYDPSSGDDLNVTGLAELPGLALLGPELIENRMYSTNELIVVPLADGISTVRRPPYTVDVVFSVVGITEQNTQALNLMQLVVNFFERNRSISILADPMDPGRGSCTYDLAVLPDGDPKMDVSPDNSNRRMFSARFKVIGFDIDEFAGFASNNEISRTAQVIDDITLQIEQKTEDAHE